MPELVVLLLAGAALLVIEVVKLRQGGSITDDVKGVFRRNSALPILFGFVLGWCAMHFAP